MLSPLTSRLPSRISPKLIASLLAVTIAAAFWLTPSAESIGANAKPVAVLELSPADIAIVAQGAVNQRVALSGTLQALNLTTLSSEVEATLASVQVRPGDYVHKGQLLLSFDNRDLKNRVDAQEAALASARAQLNLAQKNYDRNQDLARQNFISENSSDTTRQNLEVSTAGVKAAEAQLAILRKSLAAAEVRAPFAGYVSERLVQPGQRVGIMTRLISLVDLSTLELEGNVAVAHVANLKPGQAMSFRVEGFGQREFSGKLSRINPAAQSSSRTIPVYIQVNNPHGELKAGMFAQGELTLAAASAGQTLPLAAIREENQQRSVLVIRNGKVERQAVELGLQDDKTGIVQVLSGLKSGEQAVLAKVSNLSPGQPVKVQAKNAA